ncbi:MAG TPA: DNA (cytosine-5-)-methyltransferase [Cyanobacteria bacterium UBA11162]|nr:DNA (cytosine-5-)-methyltransferase [Cyanobacteria bacterium UBA11162]
MSGLDLFAGCGGLSLGFQNVGFDIIAAFDNWEPAIKVYQKNFFHQAFLCDIQSLDKDFNFLKKLNSELIIGGPPCQDFSSAGKRNEYLGRGNLTLIFAEIIAAVKPKWFVMENVDRVAKSNIYKIARNIFKDAGYGISEKILDASLCGVPQKRKRFFCVGELEGQDKKLESYFEANLAKYPLTVREYFRDYLEENIGIEHYYRHPRSYRRRAIFSIDEPSPTVRGVNRPIPKTYKEHPGDSTGLSSDLRPLSTLERSYIQTFPRNFIFEGSKTDLEQMIGNAVPVKLAEYVARCLLQYIQEKNCNSLNSSNVWSIQSDEQAIQLCLPL